MLEVLLALFLFSITMLGSLSVQITGKRAGHDALQRTVAVSLAWDMIARIRANPGQMELYRFSLPAEDGSALPEPATDCDSAPCTESELAHFDL